VISTEVLHRDAGWVRVDHGAGPEAFDSAIVTLVASRKMGVPMRRTHVRVWVNGALHDELTGIAISSVEAASPAT